ncbi:MAG: transcriptional regulator, partial [Holophagaceae bacterium]|nr:transcriptional regulator [Holophagaceae bacterium]
MLFSTATGYALRALAALPEDGTFCLAKDLSSKLELPGPYLAKILQGLVQADILESVRGPKGGFRLTRPSHRITVGEVVAALEGPDALEGCIMGFPTCGGDHPCPLHDAWGAVKAQVSTSMT